MKKISTLIAVLVCLICEAHAQTPSTFAEHNYSSFTDDKKIITPELQSLTDKQFYDHPEFGVLPYNAPCADCIELLQKRDETHRYFVKNGSKGHEFYSQTAYSNLNYYDASGHLVTIDYRIKPTAQNGVFSASHQPFPLTVNLRDKYVSIINGGKELLVNRNVTLYIKKTDGTIKSMGEPSWSDYTAGDDGVVIHNLYPGIDLELRMGEGHVESFYRINKPLHLDGGELVIHDNVQLPAGFVYDHSYSDKLALSSPSSGGNTDNRYEGPLFINSGTGKHYFIVASPAAFDENKNSSESDYAIRLPYTTGEGGGLDLYMPVSWMNDPNRSYPLVIDPYVTVTDSLPSALITSSGYSASCVTFTGGCSYNMNLTVPPACTVNNILVSFWYESLGTCDLDQGAYDITSGSCRYPTIGTWKTCNSSLPGICESTNLSLFKNNNIQSCIPAPSCSSYSLPFTLDFYRCVDSSACGNFSCITVVPDHTWSMTIEGYTTAVSAVGGEAKQSAITLCAAGLSFQLTANVDSGIPPDNYTWQPGDLIGDTVTVSPNTTTTYTVTASVCGGIDTATATVSVTLDTSANASFTLYADSGQLHTYTIVNLATGVPPIQYYWTWGDGGYDTIPYPSHIYVDSGFYTICLSITDSTGCQSTYCDSSFHAMRTTNTMVYVNVVPPLVTGTQAINSKTSAVTIYPNPATNQLTIHTSCINTNESVTISIINVLGQTMQEEKINWNNEASINIKTLSSGIYFVQLQNESGARWVGRFVKE